MHSIIRLKDRTNQFLQTKSIWRLSKFNTPWLRHVKLDDRDKSIGRELDYFNTRGRERFQTCKAPSLLYLLSIFPDRKNKIGGKAKTQTTRKNIQTTTPCTRYMSYRYLPLHLKSMGYSFPGRPNSGKYTLRETKLVTIYNKSEVFTSMSTSI